VFAGFLPAISKQALQRLSRTVRRWQLHRRTELRLAELAELINPVVRGWMQYDGAFSRSALSMLLARINTYLVGWTPKKDRRLCAHSKARAAWTASPNSSPAPSPTGRGSGTLDDQAGTSGVTGDCHAPFHGSPG
jgi:RNA-directed DNA polymerase